MERATKDNLKKTLTGESSITVLLLRWFLIGFLELGLTDGHNIVVADVTTPKPLSLTVKFVDNMEWTLALSLFIIMLFIVCDCVVQNASESAAGCKK